MNSVDDHIVNEAKIACYTDDIAIWHSHTDITISENVLNENLSHIEDWAKQLKLLIYLEKKTNTVCFLLTEGAGQPFSRIKVYQAYRAYTAKGFKEAQYSSKTLRGSTYGSKPKTFLNTHTALIRPILKYAAPVWAPSASTSTGNIDSVQYRTSKIIIETVSSTNNMKAEIECGLTSLKSRRKLTTIKFTNKIRSCGEQHISNITFRFWTTKNRLKRSSTLQCDKDIRNDSNLNLTCLDIIQEPCFPVKPPPSAKIILDFLEPCTKNEPRDTIKRKYMNTIIGLMRPRLVTAYTDGSSDSDPIDIYLALTNIANSDGLIVLSDCRSALEAIKEGKTGLTQEITSLLFSIGALGKSCTLQWIPAHVDIEVNEMADSLANEARTLEPLT
ncbi:RNase H domain-containing protein [Trichonephila clavipes]|nr:RNase H domain-containing protein [Trichonephila clavipes]